MSPKPTALKVVWRTAENQRLLRTRTPKVA